MKDWEKRLRRASLCDKIEIDAAVVLLGQHVFPPDTLRLKGTRIYRTRIGNWRIKFHYDNAELCIDEIVRRNEKTYKNDN